jgi:alkyl sulfatase BDS1-like metallo-beta-lactamase superfamily hydrolase
MGGADAILARARADFERGEYRWVAEVLNRLVFAEPENRAARELQADTLTQLGYQQVSATWRNVYLMAAMELRQGVTEIPTGARTPDYIAQLPPDMLLDYAGVALAQERAAGKSLSLNLEFGSPGQTFQVAVSDGLLIYRSGPLARADASVALTNQAFNDVVGGRVRFDDAVQQGAIVVSGDVTKAREFFGLFETFAPSFNIVTP